MTAQAGGDPAGATIEVILGNVVGTFLSPALVQMFFSAPGWVFAAPVASGKGGTIEIYREVSEQVGFTAANYNVDADDTSARILCLHPSGCGRSHPIHLAKAGEMDARDPQGWESWEFVSHRRAMVKRDDSIFRTSRSNLNTVRRSNFSSAFYAGAFEQSYQSSVPTQDVRDQPKQHAQMIVPVPGGSRNPVGRPILPDGQRDWSYGLFGCFEDIGTSAFACLLPCGLYALTKQTARKSTGGRPPRQRPPPFLHPIADWGATIAPILPPETLLQIFNLTAYIWHGKHVPDSPTLRSLSLVSHQFRQLAQPLLSLNIRVLSESQALSFLASDLEQHIWELEILGQFASQSSRTSVSDRHSEQDFIRIETVAALIAVAGKLGLRKLKLTTSPSFDARILENAGPGKWELKFLDFESNLTDSKPGEGWNFPFHLTHLGTRDEGITPPGFLSALVDCSPSLSSLSTYLPPIQFRSALERTPDIFSLPNFPSCAANITHLKDDRIDACLPSETLAHLTSLTHLTYKSHLNSIQDLHNQLEHFPSSTPTITHLCIRLGDAAFELEGDAQLWKTFLELKVLEALEEIHWDRMRADSKMKPKCVIGETVVRQTFGLEGYWW
ncbi:hypothetical protein P7C70_g3523, partial [Phenoliferia sp. Uapishka_3]